MKLIKLPEAPIEWADIESEIKLIEVSSRNYPAWTINRHNKIIGIVRLTEIFRTHYWGQMGSPESIAVRGTKKPVHKYRNAMAPVLGHGTDYPVFLPLCHLTTDVISVVAEHLWSIK